MIKHIAFASSIAILLLGCGGGSSTTDTGGKIGAQSHNKAYDLWAYMVPSSSQTNTFTHISNGKTSTYTTTYSVSQNRVEERDDYAQNEKTIYERFSDKITVKFEKDGKPNGMYDLALGADIGDIVTIRNSTCSLSKHYDDFSIADKSFQDVIEITCNNIPGYYQKGVGEVAQKEDSVGKNIRVLSR